MQPIQGVTPRPLGEPPSPFAGAGEQPLSTQQLTALERLIARIDDSLRCFQATPQTVLTPAQIQDILGQVFLKHAGHQPVATEARDIQPIYNPMFSVIIDPDKGLNAWSLLAFIALVVVMLVLWLVM